MRVGDRRQETTHPSPLPSQPTPNPDRGGEGKTGEMGMSEEVGAKFCPLIFLPNYAPKILTF
ncbi:hypothetical protein CYANOKiyG1_09930 [Okeania sp. KiyG1]|nr:hypothetical protein CYANOKiyG1_09930 [Okeania sp. KiyG1]